MVARLIKRQLSSVHVFSNQ